MSARLFYLAWAIAVLAFTATAQTRGWWLAKAERQRVAPQSVRSNPGAYRPIYRGTYRTFRGK